MNSKLKYIFLFLIFSLFCNVCFCAESHTPEPYNTEEFPQALKDLRRFEIITLGSMPFVMMDCNFVYAGVRVANGKATSYKPFNTSSYSQSEQIGLILSSLTISTSIGITDFVVQKIKSSQKTKKINKNKNDSIIINSIEEDPAALKISAPVKSELDEEENSD